MPGRIYREIEASRERNNGTFDLSRLWNRFLLPRWAWATAAVGIVLVISWVVLRSPQPEPELSFSEDYNFSGEIVVADSADPEALPLSELDRDDLNTVDAWAGTELASIARVVDQSLMYSPDTDINEELAELSDAEMERLSTMLTQG